MTLNRIDFDYESVTTPCEIVAFLEAVDDLVEQHRVNTATRFRGFVPSDYVAIYRCLTGALRFPFALRRPVL